MARTVPFAVQVTGMAQVVAAMTEAVNAAVAAERQRFAILVRATCACQSCKDGVAAELLRGAG